MTLIINVSLNSLAQELISAAIANSFSPQMDTNLLHHVGLASSAGGQPSLSILNQLTPHYAAAAAAAAALAARGPITTSAASLPYTTAPLSLSQQGTDNPQIPRSPRTKSETKDKLAKLSILGVFK